MGRKKFFMGKEDSNRVSLENIFPLSDIVFSSPFYEVGKYHRVVVEGNPKNLEELAIYLQCLLGYDIHNSRGHWVSVTPFEPTDGLQIFYDHKDQTLDVIELLVFVLRNSLVNACNLKLTLISRVIGVRNHIIFLDKPVPLTEPYNGRIELKMVILPGSKVN